MKRTVNVAAGILYKNNQILITSRPDSKTYAGYWEFPGGKIENGEVMIEALIRELEEELGVIVKETDCEYITTIIQEYDEKCVNLDLIRVNAWEGELASCEEQKLYFHTLGTKCQLSPLLPTTEKVLAILEQK